MSFSVLGTVIPGTILEEKRCVEKTWPSWWDDLPRKVCINSVNLREVYVDVHDVLAWHFCRGRGNRFFCFKFFWAITSDDGFLCNDDPGWYERRW